MSSSHDKWWIDSSVYSAWRDLMGEKTDLDAKAYKQLDEQSKEVELKEIIVGDENPQPVVSLTPGKNLYEPWKIVFDIDTIEQREEHEISDPALEQLREVIDAYFAAQAAGLADRQARSAARNNREAQYRLVDAIVNKVK